MSKHLTPAEVVEALIGKPAIVGAILAIHVKTPFGWRRATKFRDAGDITSPVHMRALLAHSAARGLGLTADHLIWGASAEEVAAILAARGPAQVAAE